MTRPPTILDAHSLPPAWQRRFYELIAERNVARSDAEIAALDAAMRRILDAHRNGSLRKWATASPEGLLCAHSEF